MRERVGYLIAALAVVAALVIDAVAGDEPTYAEREARAIAAATQRMSSRWDNEHSDDARRAIAKVNEQASQCRRVRRSALTVALLTSLERAGGEALDQYTNDLIDVHAGDGVLRRGIRARVRDHRELAGVDASPCRATTSGRKLVRRHRQRTLVIAAASERLLELGVKSAVADRFADPELPVRAALAAALRR